MFVHQLCFHTLLLVVITYVMAQEKECHLTGEKGKESPQEKETLNALKELFGESFQAEDSEYIYKFRLCQEVDSNISNSGLVQISKKDQKKTLVGRINNTHLASGSKWIMLLYKGGENYDNHCDKEERKALVMFICNPKTLSKGFTIITEDREKVRECAYIFELESRLACLSEDAHLSVGSILLIIFASVVGVYIIGGFLYQRLIVGGKGMEQFPHFAFWQDLGNLVADGCDFVCRSAPRNAPAAYRGVGDDQLGEESEERDDHLLPM